MTKYKVEIYKNNNGEFNVGDRQYANASNVKEGDAIEVLTWRYHRVFVSEGKVVKLTKKTMHVEYTYVSFDPAKGKFIARNWKDIFRKHNQSWSNWKDCFTDRYDWARVYVKN